MIYIAWSGEDAYIKALQTVKQLRNNGICVEYNYIEQSFSKSLKYADKRKASHVLIIGADEVTQSYFTLKNLSTGEQEKILEKDLLRCSLNGKTSDFESVR